jgi:hypothetical protein
MLSLETKQAGGKLLHHSDLRGGEREYLKKKYHTAVNEIGRCC